nr:hypothetical protein [Xanthomonas campestris]
MKRGASAPFFIPANATDIHQQPAFLRPKLRPKNAFSSARKLGHAACRYWKPDHNVSNAAIARVQYPAWKIRLPSQISCVGICPGVTEYSKQSNATICAVVLTLPIIATRTLARWPISAIHSRNADTAISRPTMTAAQNAIHGVGCPCTMRNNATATISLSATGSRNAPNAEYW